MSQTYTIPSKNYLVFSVFSLGRGNGEREVVQAHPGGHDFRVAWPGDAEDRSFVT
jgi:hypothetical protein